MSTIALGLPGDTIREDAFDDVTGNNGHHGKSVEVPKGKIWVEGDNVVPGESKDSRTYGTVPIGLMEGVVFCRLWPTFASKRSWMSHWKI